MSATVVRAKTVKTLTAEFEAWMEQARKIVTQLPDSNVTLKAACVNIREHAFDMHASLRIMHDYLDAAERAEIKAKERAKAARGLTGRDGGAMTG
jgi:hypothetical protein